ncbi:MAG: hypothetical protein JO108_09030 [Acidobacteriaceae bacterium]|nr:hypothetical protein [Acidobacteriaceae bacterium]
MRALDWNTKRRTHFRLYPSVKTTSRVRRYFPVCGSRTIGPVCDYFCAGYGGVRVDIHSTGGFDIGPPAGIASKDRYEIEPEAIHMHVLERISSLSRIMRRTIGLSALSVFPVPL